jgi:hypothetical protein
MSLEIYNLDERANEFLEISLRYAGAYGAELAKQHSNLSDAHKWTVLPKGIREDKEYAFGQSITGISDSTNGDRAVDEVVRKIRRHLLEDRKNVVIMSYWEGSKGDPWIEKAKERVYFFGSEVYFVLLYFDAEETGIKQYLKANLALPYSNIFLSSSLIADSIAAARGELTLEMFHALISSTVSIIASAYDGEGYVIADL